MPQPQSDSQNLVYTIVTILFALSLIAERIANMYKLYWPGLRLKKDTANAEKIRERNMMWTALVCGWIVAVIAGADFFTLIQKGGLLNIFGKDFPQDGSNVAKCIFGFFLSGIFISLGSKFWHDMLDIVLQFSNLKKYQVSQAAAAAPGDIQTQTLQKTANISTWLKSLPGYRGNEPDTATTNVMILFDQQPAASVAESLDNYLGAGNYSIRIADLKLH